MKQVSSSRPNGKTQGAPRVLVLRAPGVNCDRETAHAFERVGAEVASLHVNRLIEDRRPLDDANVLCVPGGFSFGDDLGAGKIFGNKLALKLRGSVLRLVDRGGLVLGICNGFQVLVRAGLIPGTRGLLEEEAALARNLSGKFESRWTRLEITSRKSPFLSSPELAANGGVFDVPVAHGEGRLVISDPGVMERMRKNGQIALVYRRPAEGEHPGVSGHGVASGPAGYPWNPAGSTDDIAGITDPTGRILGLMPHPERHQDPWQRPGFARGSRGPAAGLEVFRAAVEHLRNGSSFLQETGGAGASPGARALA